MGNSSSSGRKLSPFSLKMAEGVFPAKVCHPRTATTPPRLPPPGRPPPPIDTATAPCAMRCTPPPSVTASSPHPPPQVGAPSGAISTAMYFEALPSAAALKALIREQLLSFDTFGCLYRNGRWVEPPGGVDVEQHVIEATVSSDAEMLAYCEKEMVRPLRNGTAAPLWELHLVANTARGGRSLLLFRNEHALGDGVALNQVLSRLATDVAGRRLPPASYTRPPKAPGKGPCALLAEALRAVCKYLSAPFGPYDSDTPLVRPLAERRALTFGARRKAVLVPEHSLDMVKRIKNLTLAPYSNSKPPSLSLILILTLALTLA